MTKWEDMFKIDVERVDNWMGRNITKTRYWVVYKTTGEKAITGKRTQGYSTEIDAKIGAAHKFRHYQRQIEKALLG